MQDIKQLIEEESINYADAEIGIDSKHDVDTIEQHALSEMWGFAHDDFQNGASFTLSLFRWRKVEDFKDFGSHVLFRVPDKEKGKHFSTQFIRDSELLNDLLFMIEIETQKDPNYPEDVEWMPIPEVKE